MAIATFVIFTMNPPEIYSDPAEHMALMNGFIAISYLVSIFLSESWIHCTIGQALSTLAMIWFYDRLGYKFQKIGPTLIMTTISCGFNSY